jgi:chorismate synthase
MPTANQTGQIFRVTTFGESHGAAIGCVIDGCPSGIPISLEHIQSALDRRRPGQAAWTSARQEPDHFEILSGVHEGKTLGTPIAALIRNVDARSSDYQEVIDGTKKRVGHADDLWREKFSHADLRGGGRASGRETASRVLAGAIAEQVVQALLKDLSCRLVSYVSQVGPLVPSPEELNQLRSHLVSSFAHQNSAQAQSWDPRKYVDQFAVRFPSLDSEKSFSKRAESLLVEAVKEGKSYGGVADVFVFNPPRGLGQPVFHKLKADLAGAYLSVGATSGVEFGDGFSAALAEGTEFHESAIFEKQYGGIRGGITTGEPLFARVAFKPTSTVMDLAKRGRHDPCIVPRAIPVLEAMTWLVLCDHLLWSRLDR